MRKLWKKQLSLVLCISLILGLLPSLAYAEQTEAEALKLEIIDVTASGHDGNFPENTLDDNLSTRWSAQSAKIEDEVTGQWIQYDLGSVKTIGYLGIAFASGDKRRSFFEIDISEDGSQYTNVYTGESSGTTLGLEPYDINEQEARYVRITGYGNTTNLWNSISVVHIYPPNLEGLILDELAPPPPEVPVDTTPYTVAGLYDNQGNPHAVHTPNVVTGVTHDVTAYGAIANDNQDDVAAIQAAFAAAVPGDEIYFPDGTYDLIGTLSNDGTSHIALKSGVNVRGESQAGSILKSHFDSNTANSKVMNAFGQHDIVISNLTFTSTFSGAYSTNHQINNPNRGGPENVIYIEDRLNQPSYNITLDFLTIEKFQRMGVRISRSHDIVVRNSTFQNATDVGGGGAGYGISIQGIAKVDRLGYANDSKHNLVENSNFIGPYIRHGVLIQNYSHNNAVRNNYFDGMILDAIDLHGEDEYLNKIEGNNITGVLTGAGIALGNTGGTAPSNHDASGPFNHIVNNTISNSREGIKVYLGTPDTLIESNTITNTTEPNNAKGIYILNAPRTIVRDNIITNNSASGFWGIVLEHDIGDVNAGNVGKGDPKDILISGNSITGNSNGMRVEAGTYVLDNNTISGNINTDFIDNSSPPPAEVTTEVLQPTKDALVDIERPGENYGIEDPVKTADSSAADRNYFKFYNIKRNSDGSKGRIAYYQFNVTDASTITNATFELTGRATGTKDVQLAVFGLTDDQWDEDSITWNNSSNHAMNIVDVTGIGDTASSLGSFTIKSLSSGTVETYTLDVTSFVNQQSDGVITIMVADVLGQNENVNMYSKEEGNSTRHPSLVVEKSEGGEGIPPTEPETFPVPDPVIQGNMVTITAMADSMVRDGTAYTDVNYGSDIVMKIKERTAPNSGYERRIFMKFDLSALSGEVESAKLMLYNNGLESGNPQGYHVKAQGIEDDSWTEMGITNTNQPQVAEDLDTVHVIENEAYVEFDVTAFVSNQTDGKASFRMIGVEDNLGADYVSRENTNVGMPPLLVVTMKEELATEILTAIEDSYVTEQTPDDNFGTANLKVKKNVTSGVSYYRDGFFKFDLSEFNGQIESAEFKVFITSLDSNTKENGYDVEVRGMQDDAWDELTLSYNNQPTDIGISIGEPVTIVDSMANSYISFDVSEFVQEHTDSIISLRMRGVTDRMGGNYASRESSVAEKRPVLVLTLKASEQEDTIPPSSPTELVANSDNSKVELNWEAAEDNIGVTSYIISRDGVEIGRSAVTSFIDEEIVGGTTYSYQVIAVDAAGNHSDPATVSITINESTLESIAIAEIPPLVVGGSEHQVQVIGLYSDNSTKPITSDILFRSSNPEVASITVDGIINPSGIGSSVIRASYGQLFVDYTITVYAYYYETNVSEDTFVRLGQPAQGNQPTMNIKTNSNGSDNRRAYLKFDLPTEIPTTFDQALVRVYVTSLESSTPAEGYQITIYGLNDDEWSELDLTYETQPQAAELAVALSTVQVNRDSEGMYIDFDVTEFVRTQTDGKASFFIQSAGPSSRGAHYASKENALNKPPLLLITESIPAQPQNVEAKAEQGEIQLTWTKVNGASTYIVKRSLTEDGTFEVVAETDELQYTDSGLRNGSTYYYVISAKNTHGESDPSAVISATPLYTLVMGSIKFTDLNNEPVATLLDAGFLKTSVDLTNQSDLDQSGTVIVALYKGDTMDSISFVNKLVGVGKTVTFETGFSLPSDLTNYYVKVFVWDSFDNMVPITESITFPQ